MVKLLPLLAAVTSCIASRSALALDNGFDKPALGPPRAPKPRLGLCSAHS